eukprot:TRINITY_DN6635_c0_g1_i1.p1 TRINITY_DN6635_c0_g1~~TRINITY_DN6635_c0_g1_i1.p1  ORF type:complete len:256 (-),score=42.43 TRINITY_DN6635_c0_g1_i1:73-840(-)
MREPLLGGAANRAPETHIVYTFTGKLAIAPLFIFTTLVSTALLFSDGKAGFQKSADKFTFYYGLAGIGLFAASVGFLIALLRLFVFRISFDFTPSSLVIRKTGFFRSSTLEFNASLCSLHYLRTHFSEEKAWLSLVVRERDRYYKICSWRGLGNQQRRFLALFRQLKQAQQSTWVTPASFQKRTIDEEIVTREEVTLISPFKERLQRLAEETATGEKSTVQDDSSAVVVRLCIEDLDVVVCDSFFGHFRGKEDAE